MSIETTLTLLVAGGILLFAAVLKATFHGLMWLVAKVSGREMPAWRSRRGAVAAVPRVPVTTWIGHALRGTGLFALFVVATIAHAIRLLAELAGRATEDVYDWIAPRGRRAYATSKRTTIAAYRYSKPRVANGLERLGEWWVHKATPFLLETGEATRDLVTSAPEHHGDIRAFERTTPVLTDVR
jgi:hypothetical protein